MSGNRQARAWTLDDFHRFAQQSAGGVVFVLAVGNLQPRDHEESRMHAADDRDRARLTALMIFAHDEIAVLSFRAHDRGDIVLVRLHAIGAVIDPAGIRILHHHHAAGADVIAAVQFMPFRHRNLEQIDRLTLVDIFQHRACIDGLGRKRLRFLHIAAPIMHELERARIAGIAQRQMNALDRGEDIGDDAVAARIARHLVEEHRLVAGLALVEIYDAADLVLAIGAGDVLDFSGRLHLRDPAS